MLDFSYLTGFIIKTILCFNKNIATFFTNTYIHTYIFGTNTRNRARPRTFSKLWSA